LKKHLQLKKKLLNNKLAFTYNDIKVASYFDATFYL